MTGLKEETWNDIYAIRAMKDYIQTGGAHAAAVRKELRERLGKVRIGQLIMNDVLATGDPDLIRDLFAQIGTEAIASDTSYDGDPIDPLSKVPFEQVCPAHRIETFDLLHPLSPKTNPRIPRLMISEAVAAGDAAFLKHLAKTYPDEDISASMLDPLAIEEALPEHYAFWEGALSKFAPNSPELLDMAYSAARQQHPRAVAVLMKTGVRIKPALERLGISGNPWPVRLLRRVGSHHAELQLLSSLPSIEEIFKMTPKELQHLLGGLSPREEKAAKKLQKKAERAARQEAESK